MQTLGGGSKAQPCLVNPQALGAVLLVGSPDQAPTSKIAIQSLNVRRTFSELGHKP